MVKRKYIDKTETENGDEKPNGQSEVKEETLEVHHVPLKI